MTLTSHITRSIALCTALLCCVGGMMACAGDDDWQPAKSERQLLEEGALAALTHAPVPVETAMRRLGQRGRGHDPLVAPLPSEDRSAETGWNGLIELPEGADEGMPAVCEQAADPEVCWGERLRLTKLCNGCHWVDGTTQGAGPNWKGVFGSTRQFADGSSAPADEDYLRSAVRNPGTQVVQGFIAMAPVPVPVDDDELNALIAYIKSLK